MHWAIDDLDRWYGMCTRKIVFYHLDTDYQLMNIDIGKSQKNKKNAYRKRDSNIAKARYGAWHCTWVLVCTRPTGYTLVRMAIQVSLMPGFFATCGQ